MLDGKPGGIGRFMGHWALRSALLIPGLAVSGIRDKRLLIGALSASTFVSLFLILFTAAERARKGEEIVQRGMAGAPSNPRALHAANVRRARRLREAHTRRLRGRAAPRRRVRRRSS